MSGDFTDRDERIWQRRAEERIAAPWALGTFLRSLRSRRRVRGDRCPEALGRFAQISG
ncbi:hypothetical protein ACFY8W_25745 [Streptomyces sp. NPDC012637]|uniref:hypothetical protein n=1 Tax=Streptomyces sp. NPDC012637 TaxID=3364842 RepID=UPI0036EBCB35